LARAHLDNIDRTRLDAGMSSIIFKVFRIGHARAPVLAYGVQPPAEPLEWTACRGHALDSAGRAPDGSHRFVFRGVYVGAAAGSQAQFAAAVQLLCTIPGVQRRAAEVIIARDRR
jgi:hypothetical protein